MHDIWQIQKQTSQSNGILCQKHQIWWEMFYAPEGKRDFNFALFFINLTTFDTLMVVLCHLWSLTAPFFY